MKNPNSTTVFPPYDPGKVVELPPGQTIADVVLGTPKLSIRPEGVTVTPTLTATLTEPHQKAPMGMSPEQFVFWLQGVVFAARNGLTKEQFDCIRAALDGVKHVRN
jgi:hypothetical protein